MKNTTIKHLLKHAGRPLLSLEFYPPKTYYGFGLLGGSVERMKLVHPDFVSVTYGAGGSTHERSLTACELLRKMGFQPVVAHLTCVGASRDDLARTIDAFYADGFRNIMALRGDPPEGDSAFSPAPDGLAYAADLVALIREMHPDMCVGVAGYPEGHPEAPSLEKDIAYLKNKVNAGADFITTQLFFDNQYYYSFVERCRAAGIAQPIFPGLMPMISLNQVKRIMALSGAAFPDALRAQMEAAGGSGAVCEAVGMAWTVAQINDLLEHDAPGIHLYILNRAQTATTPALVECLNQWR